MLRRPGFWIILVLVLIVGGIQLVPYGHDRTNPPVLREPGWDSPRTRDLAVAACFDCHSNQTVWPWYSRVASSSWLLQNHITEGRYALNFSEWSRADPGLAATAARVVKGGEMPPWEYKITHPAGQLSETETADLAAGLSASLSR
jgi:hypothetical protein